MQFSDVNDSKSTWEFRTHKKVYFLQGIYLQCIQYWPRFLKRPVYNYLSCHITQNDFYCIQNSTFIWEKVCTTVYKVYTNNYFDLTFVDKLQQCPDLSVYKFLIWFDLCIQKNTMIWPPKKAENWWKIVDNFLHWFQISVYNCPSCFSSQNYTP